MKFVIGDFGFGKGKLRELLKENKMYSFDHHNIINDRIIACDMKSVPPKRWRARHCSIFIISYGDKLVCLCCRSKEMPCEVRNNDNCRNYKISESKAFRTS